MNFKLNKSKFELRAPEVQYVGHVISKDGLKVSPEKITRISSTIHSTPGRSENISRTVLQNTSGAELIPNGSLQ
jgi:hypothetical protein